jgi:hypothetical protein
VTLWVLLIALAALAKGLCTELKQSSMQCTMSDIVLRVRAVSEAEGRELQASKDPRFEGAAQETFPKGACILRDIALAGRGDDEDYYCGPQQVSQRHSVEVEKGGLEMETLGQMRDFFSDILGVAGLGAVEDQSGAGRLLG